MMRRATIESAQMDVGFRGLRKALEKISHQFDLEIAGAFCSDLRIQDTIGPSAKINRGSGERFVHGHQEIAGAQDAAFGAERFLYGFAEGDADVFDGMMLVHIEVATGIHAEIKRTVARNQLEHVVEEADSRGNARRSTPIEIQFQPDVHPVALALNFSSPC